MVGGLDMVVWTVLDFLTHVASSNPWQVVMSVPGLLRVMLLK